MKFEEAFDIVFEENRQSDLKEGKTFVVSPSTAKILTFLWNMLAVASQDGKILLDDFAYLDNNYNIRSKQINTGKKSTANKKTAKKNNIEAANNEQKSQESNEETGEE
jgi:hypothetical protein